MQPYLSFVVTARNDDYGGDFLHRMRLFLSALAALSDRHRLRAELVVVEWNPPANRPRLQDAVDWPRTSLNLSVRIIEVPAEVHNELPGANKMPMFEYLAKNVGIRRACGEFVLTTNPDIIFSDELIAYFAQGNLPVKSFQKADRYDVEKRVPLDVEVGQMLRLCRRNVVRIWVGDYPPIDPRLSIKVRSFLSRPNPVRLVRWARRKMTPRNSEKTSDRRASLRPSLHLGATGDFLLLGRQPWHDLRGFPELLSYGGIDLYMVYLAWAAGLKQVVLPHRIYHQEHDRSEQALRPYIELDRMPGFHETLETNRPVIINGDNWGLGDVALRECEIAAFGRRNVVVDNARSKMQDGEHDHSNGMVSTNTSRSLVSIVLPTYNRADRLPGALESCLRQTYRHLEVIVVDDGSTDSTSEVLASFQRQDQRVRCIRQKNQKLPAALNAGFRASRGELLTWISDDNRFHEDAIEIMAQALDQNPDVGLVYCGYDIVDAQGNLLQKVCPPGPEEIFNLNCVQACFMYRRKVRDVIGDYDPAWLYVEDYDYWLRVQKQFKLAHLPDVQPYSFVTHGQSLTSRLGGPKQRMLVARARMHHASPWTGKLRILAATPADLAETYAERRAWGRAFVACLLYLAFKPWRRYRWRRSAEILRIAQRRMVPQDTAIGSTP